MKTVFDELSPAERRTLARLYEMDEYKVLKRVIEISRLNAATRALDALTWEETKHLQGQAHGLKHLHLNIKELHKQSIKD